MFRSVKFITISDTFNILIWQKKSYSNDIRQRIIDFYNQVIRHFNISTRLKIFGHAIPGKSSGKLKATTARVNKRILNIVQMTHFYPHPKFCKEWIKVNVPISRQGQYEKYSFLELLRATELQKKKHLIVLQMRKNI